MKPHRHKTRIITAKIGLLSVFLLLAIGSFGQGRSFIRQKIKEWGACRNVAITKTNGDLALYGRNGCAKSRLPYKLSKTITELNRDNKYIDDIQLTENGSWLILYGTNGFRWSGIPYSLEKKLRQYNNDYEVVYSVTFNDAGDWIIISKDHYASSDSRITAWLKKGTDEFGRLWAACVTDDALVAVYARGYKFLGDVPYSLKKALEKTRLNVYRLKIAGSAWFFADKKSNYEYSM
jgi:hypothetical protein